MFCGGFVWIVGLGFLCLVALGVSRVENYFFFSRFGCIFFLFFWFFVLDVSRIFCVCGLLFAIAVLFVSCAGFVVVFIGYPEVCALHLS